jgi:uncharacterized repeat protein (TIGR03803 family)
VFYAFQGGSDGYAPEGNLLLDASSNLYGTTSRGGAFGNPRYGTVYKLASDGTKTILHSFGALSDDGRYPDAGLVADSAGNLYGTTSTGGANGFQGGTVFKISPDGTETVLRSFCSAANCADGHDPEARLLLDNAGDLYGTTVSGGQFNEGTVFRISAQGAFSVVYSFGAYSGDAAGPQAGLVADASGNLYGTTRGGGEGGAGTVFEIAPSGSESLLHQFHFLSNDGAEPEAEVLLDGKQNVFGTTLQDGTARDGTAFRIRANGNFKILRQFGRSDRNGIGPDSALLSMNGLLYGVTQFGGRGCRNTGCGLVYQLTP